MQKIKKWAKLLKKDQRGLTLVELLAVVVILAIVGLIAFIAINTVIENSKEDAHVANAQQVISAAELHVASGGELASFNSQIDSYVDLTDPWQGDEGAQETYTFTVGGDETEIKVSSDHTNCKITSKPKDYLAENGRDACE